MGVLEVKKCAACGTDMPDTGNGIFACPHCDFPHPGGVPCDQCKALRKFVGSTPQSDETAEPSTPQE
jgi:predicted RNA-binding Zn-ribbon protein involved in translation (DUF1610 family)